MTLRFKSSVSLAGVQPEIILATLVVEGVFSDSGYDCIVTSLTDSKHSWASLHYVGYAVDFRTKHLPPTLGVIPDIAALCRERLGAQFDVVIFPTHLHVEFQPKSSA